MESLTQRVHGIEDRQDSYRHHAAPECASSSFTVCFSTAHVFHDTGPRIRSDIGSASDSRQRAHQGGLRLRSPRSAGLQRQLRRQWQHAVPRSRPDGTVPKGRQPRIEVLVREAGVVAVAVHDGDRYDESYHCRRRAS